MRELNFQKNILLSAALHLIAFLITVLVFKQAHHFVVPSPYMVSLVNPDSLQKSNAGRPQSALPLRDTEESLSRTTLAMKSMRDVEEDRRRIKDKISALEAKERIKKIVELRKVISLKASAGGQAGKPGAAEPSALQGDVFDDYYRKITQEIWQQWVYPDVYRKDKDIEAIVSIRILKDGTAVVQRVEKSSGNALFDRSALKALAKASPLAPPPYEMEIGVRFSP